MNVATTEDGLGPDGGKRGPLVSWIYRRYHANGWIARFWHKCVSSRLAARLLFGIRIPEPASSFSHFNAYFDLTTILLRAVIAARVRRNPELRLCEIGVGAFATLSRSLARLARREIVACDDNADTVEKARAAAARDGSRIKVVRSDVLSSFAPGEKFDLIFWNLPYYVDPSLFLPRLFQQTPRHLNGAAAVLLIGYNSVALPRHRIESLLAASALGIRKIHAWRWNRHELLEIGAAEPSAIRAAGGPA